jgi:hypothetical protein
MQINHLATLQQRLPPSRPESSKPLNFFAQVAIFYILGRGLLIFAIDLKYYYSILLIVPTCNNYCNLTKCRSAVALKKFHFWSCIHRGSWAARTSGREKYRKEPKVPSSQTDPQKFLSQLRRVCTTPVGYFAFCRGSICRKSKCRNSNCCYPNLQYPNITYIIHTFTKPLRGGRQEGSDKLHICTSLVFTNILFFDIET